MVQPVTTAEFGEVNFDKIYRGQSARDPVTKVQVGMTGAIGRLDSGAWCHFPSCQPITEPREAKALLESIHPPAVKEFERWWQDELDKRYRDAEAPAVRPIKIVPCDEAPGSMLCFDDEDGEEVESAAEVLAFFKQAGPLQDFALQIFSARHQHVQAEEIRTELETPREKAKRELAAQIAAKQQAAKAR